MFAQVNQIHIAKMTIESRLKALRKTFNSYDIDGYIVPTTDEYISEYAPAYAKRLEYITGFTGSSGMAIILRDKTLFFTDGRYIAQSARELIHDSSYINPEIDSLDEVIGYDPMLFTESQLRPFKAMHLKAIETNLIDLIWTDQPPRPSSEVYSYTKEYTGEDSADKITRCRRQIKDKGAEYCLITSPDSICWLLNIRASDIEISPFMLGYMILGPDEMWLFTEGRDFSAVSLALDARASGDAEPPAVSLALDARASGDEELMRPSGLRPRETSEIKEFLSSLEGKCIVDKSSCPVGLSSLIKTPVYDQDPCQLMKACKNDVEIAGAKSVHIKDAIALCETFAWIMESIDHKITEYDIGLKLSEERAKQKGYLMDSFPPIVGYQDNGAIIHYKAEQHNAKTIQGQGLLLIDSGGHYLGGTTDVTRVLLIGEPTKEQKKRYTDVLKGHIALVRQKFPIGTSGVHLDILARMHLWQNGLDYAHGTGHGVGNMLSVHEGPQRISGHVSSNVPLQKGMILSNEPGFYKDGEYGIRIENLVYVDEAGVGFLGLRNLTFVPYCKDLIEFDALSHEELLYLKDYNRAIMDKVYDSLSDRAKAWVMLSVIPAK